MTAVLLSRNTAFAEFKLRGHRGSGGFSDVYEAVSNDGKRVALKVLRVPGGPNAANVERFERELRILQLINNRRIARLVAAKLDSDPPWIASEFVDGPNLREAVSEKGNFEIIDAVQFFSVVVKALSEIHAEGIAHRDITPNNILLGEFGPVIIDFGSAKENLTGDFGSVLSVGTPEFAAPEVLMGSNVGLASDIYSLAKVFHFLIGPDSETVEYSNQKDFSQLQADAIARCLLEDSKQRPTAAELAVIFPITDVGLDLTKDGYTPIEIKKLPLRIGIKVFITTICITAALVGLLAMLILKTEVEPLTLKMIQSKAAKLKPSVFLVKNDVQAGWLLSGPAFDKAPLEYRNPNSLDQKFSLLALEGYTSNVTQRTRYLEIKVELLRSDVTETIKNIDLTNSGDFPLESYPVFAHRFDNFLNNFQSEYTSGSCSILQTEKFAVQPDEKSPRIRFLGMLNRCMWEKNEVSGYAIMDVYPLQDAIVYTTANSRDGVIDLQLLLDGFEITNSSLIKDLGDNHTEMFADRSDDSFALDTSDSGKDGGFHLYAKRAFRLPAGLSAEISNISESDLSLLTEGHSPVSIYFYQPVVLGPDESLDFEDFLFPYGQVINLESLETRIFSNPTEKEMILVAEVHQTDGLSSAFQIRTKTVSIWDQFFFNDQFKASGVEVKAGATTPNKVLFVLPTDGSAEEQNRSDVRLIKGVQYLIPYNWIIASDVLLPKSSGLAISANPFGWPLNSVRLDAPRLEIYDSDLNELVRNQMGYVWWLIDYTDCSFPPVEFKKTVGSIVIRWKVLDFCLIPEEFSSSVANLRKTRQANPIIKFLVTSTFGPLNNDIEIPITMGEYVPELDTGIAFWEEFVLSLSNQADVLRKIASDKCLIRYVDGRCLSK